MAAAQVNQKLYYARLLLEHAAAATAVEGASQQALLQGALFHLTVAYRTYLAEILGLNSIDSNAVFDARTALKSAQDGISPELSELAALEQCGDWPARLLGAYNEAAAAAPHSAPISPPAADSIAVANITAMVDVATCTEWLQTFESLLDRQRQHLQES